MIAERIKNYDKAARTQALLERADECAEVIVVQFGLPAKLRYGIRRLLLAEFKQISEGK